MLVAASRSIAGADDPAAAAEELRDAVWSLVSVRIGSTIASPRMPDYKPNQFVRAFAVLALIAAFVLVVVVVATSGGGSGGGDNGERAEARRQQGRAEGRPARASGSSIPATRSARSP